MRQVSPEAMLLRYNQRLFNQVEEMFFYVRKMITGYKNNKTGKQFSLKHVG